jgi:hypothetical protein
MVHLITYVVTVACFAYIARLSAATFYACSVAPSVRRIVVTCLSAAWEESYCYGTKKSITPMRARQGQIRVAVTARVEREGITAAEKQICN